MNDIVLGRRVVFISGMTAAGKSTIARGLAGTIMNGLYLSRDDILYGGLLCVNENAPNTTLPPFQEYIANDSVLSEIIDTPFGAMRRMIHDPPSDYHARHGREQGYLVQIRLALENLKLGKVPICDGYQARHIDNGSLAKILALPEFRTYRQFLIHVVASIEECYRRLHDRGVQDEEAGIRANPYKDKKVFEEFIHTKQQPIPDGLKHFKHLLINTTDRSIDECVHECLEYIA